MQHWLLDASKMGVPQRRERVFFIALRKDLAEPFLYQQDMFTVNPLLKLEFNEPEICYCEFADYDGLPITVNKKQAWEYRKPTDINIADSKFNAGMKVSDFNCAYIYDNKPLPTLTGKGRFSTILYSRPLMLSDNEIRIGGTFPTDYKFSNIGYLVGMSVPPVMMAQIATEIYSQWLSKII